MSPSVWCDIYIAPWPSHLGIAITSMTRHLHRAIFNAASVAALVASLGSIAPVWLNNDIAPRPMLPRRHRHQHWLRGLTQTSPTSHPTLELEEYHSNQQPDSGTCLLTSPTLTRGERVITTMLWDTSPNQLSHFLSCILSWVNISIYFQLVNILL
jgi:hypothetical protein